MRKRKEISIAREGLHFPRSTHWVSEVLYGKIVITAIIIGLEGNTGSPRVVIEILVLSMLVLGLARIYVDMLATNIALGNSMTFDDAVRVVLKVLPIGVGLTLPLALFLASDLDLISLYIAFLASKVTALALLFLFGMWLSTATERHGFQRIGVALLPTMLGILVIGIKTLAH